MPKETSPQYNAKDLVLDHYHCTFFLPLIGINDKFEPKEDLRFNYSSPDLENKEAQAYRYFSPALRTILFDCGSSDNTVKAVKEWRLTDIKLWELHLGKEEDKADPTKYQKSKILSVRLFQYFNGIYILAVRVEPLVLEKLRKQKVFEDNHCNTLNGLAQADAKNTSAYQQLAMENWLTFTRHTRLLYPTFPQQNDESKIAPIHLVRKAKHVMQVRQVMQVIHIRQVRQAKHVMQVRQGEETVTAFKDKINKIQIHKKPGQDFSPVMSEFLKAFASEPDKVKGILENYENLYDDRMFVSVAYGIAGRQLPAESLQRINTLVSHVDREYDSFSNMRGYAYTPKVIQQKTKDNAFSLWEGLGGYYSFTDFSNSYLYTGWDFRTYIATEHIPFIYDKMLVQALFYQASLRYYDNQICDKTDKLLKEDDIKAIGEQRKEFVRFTNQYWFHNVTTQMQGSDIFTLQQKALGLKQHYAILKDELERTDEYLQTRHEIKIASITDKFTTYGLIFAVLALYTSLLPFGFDLFKTELKSLWVLIGGCGVACSPLQVICGKLIALLISVVPAIGMIVLAKRVRNNH